MFFLTLRLLHSCLNENIPSGRSIPANPSENVIIDNCFFIRNQVFSGSGGIISIEGVQISLSLKYTIIHESSSSLYGGALFTYGLSKSEIKMCCGSCCSSGYDHFGYIAVISTNDHIIYGLSLTKCSSGSQGEDAINIACGYEQITQTNMSNNFANYVAGPLIQNPQGMKMSYCTYSNNRPSQSVCFRSQQGSGSIHVLNSNFVSNTSPLASGIFETKHSSVFSLDSCIFYGNSNTLFYAATGSITISNSYISHLGTTQYGTVYNNNNAATVEETYLIMHFGTFYCPANNQLVIESKRLGIRSISLMNSIVLVLVLA